MFKRTFFAVVVNGRVEIGKGGVGGWKLRCLLVGTDHVD